MTMTPHTLPAPADAGRAPGEAREIDEAIAFNGVGMTYSTNGGRPRQVLDGVDLRLARGEFTALVGRSGSGKTTLLNMVAGLVDPTSGSVTVMGRRPRDARPHLGFMLARDALLPWRSALRNVEYGLELRGVPKAERRSVALHWLDAVHLRHAERLWPWQLSQGMRQRVALARTWALDPDILVMDEPFAALDMNTRQSVQQRFVDLWQSEEHRTVLFVTHDLGEAIALADRVVVIGGGRVVEDLKVDIERPRDLPLITLNRRYEEIYQHLRGRIG
ncbi:ABC transporter ATP-binding protein [Parafrankia sp. EUN1f]|uniref:ABC transporter ATP-binding protein n=1 Tax=Parafrankia sp. EUN1f TaxID=102897 RepID=UPI0001C4426D|nr:ABC transporter ATP-binding protein [Parafrankia sp. EUN1f]EFC85340.1 ABC transporter related protein [Parafrankia sp. EUN1f]